ncbi:hypothetical protein [Bosea vaviloviae]|nr:hypothetical protein [Bosea vaviloviae]
MAMLYTMRKLSWSVICSRGNQYFWWAYHFDGKSSVTWVDENNKMTGSGTYKITGNVMKMTWFKSATTESWDVPIDTNNWTGRCRMKGLDYQLVAKARNFKPAPEDEIEPAYQEIRSPAEKTAMLEQCSQALGYIVHSQTNMEIWLSTVAICYGSAYQSFNSVMNEISATQKLAYDVLLQLSLAFLGGAGGAAAGLVAGKVVKEVMASAAGQSFIIDGIKDMAKYSIRTTGAEVFKARNGARMPVEPFLWKENVRRVVLAEFGLATAGLNFWREGINNDNDYLPAGFDPLAEIKQDLQITANGQRIPVNNLPPLDENALQFAYERSWLVGWLEKCADSVTVIPGVRASVADTLTDYGLRIGVSNIRQLVKNAIPIDYDPMLIYGAPQ